MVGLDVFVVIDYDEIDVSFEVVEFVVDYGLVGILGMEVICVVGYVFVLGVEELIFVGLLYDEMFDCICDVGGIVVILYLF